MRVKRGRAYLYLCERCGRTAFSEASLEADHQWPFMKEPHEMEVTRLVKEGTVPRRVRTAVLEGARELASVECHDGEGLGCQDGRDLPLCPQCKEGDHYCRMEREAHLAAAKLRGCLKKPARVKR